MFLSSVPSKLIRVFREWNPGSPSVSNHSTPKFLPRVNLEQSNNQKILKTLVQQFDNRRTLEGTVLLTLVPLTVDYVRFLKGLRVGPLD